MNTNKSDLRLFKKQAKNFSLIPLNGKVPFENGWEKYCKTKREYYEQDFRGHNAGLCCGPASGVLVLDIDDPEMFKELNLPIPDTYTVITGSGKPHYYFLYPKGEDTYGNKSIKHLVFTKHTIFDIRGDGGQVVAPGSVHPETGEYYRIDKDTLVSPMPIWLIDYYKGQPLDKEPLLDIPLPAPKNREFIESLKIPKGKQDLIFEGCKVGERSEANMTILIMLVSAGYDDKTIFYIFDHYPIGEKYREKGSSRIDWLKNEIQRAKEYEQNHSQFASDQVMQDLALEKMIEKMNKKHAVVMVGGRCLIMNHIIDPITKRKDFTLSSVTDFNHYYANQKMINPYKENGQQTAISKIWMESNSRKEYNGIIFDPNGDQDGYYNLYEGLAIEPKQGDWSLFQKHIFEVIADKDKKAYDYIIAWLAHLVQFPGGQRPGTSIVLRGKQGTGKGCFVSQIGKIVGSHYCHISHQDQLTGRFNSHLQNALLVFCDEGIWGGNKAAEGKLKAMVTEDVNIIEPKGKDAYSVKNHIRLIVASNNDWVVPAGLEERRFFVLDVSDNHMQDKDYFKPLFEQMDNGGREAMLYDLLHYDLSDIDLRSFPRTKALMDQISRSMTSFQKFWFERLQAGLIKNFDDGWKQMVETESIYDDFVTYCKDIGERFRIGKSEFGKQLKKLCPGISNKRVVNSHGMSKKRVPYYCFPDLKHCREAFESMVKMNIEWDEYEEIDEDDIDSAWGGRECAVGNTCHNISKTLDMADVPYVDEIPY